MSNYGVGLRNGVPFGICAVPSLTTGGPTRPSLSLGFLTQTLDSRISFNRNTAATQFGINGSLQYSPSNSIRNNTMVGAVSGSPGTMPTNWSIIQNGITGMSFSVVGTGILNGINYIDLRINGTPSATSSQGIQLLFDTSSGIPAAPLQPWTQSAWVSIAAGTTAGITGFVHNTQQYNATVFVASNTNSFTPTSAFSRYSSSVTFSSATTTHVVPLIGIGTTASVAVDITIRVGMPQLEIGPQLSAVIATTNAAKYGARLDYDPSSVVAQNLLLQSQDLSNAAWAAIGGITRTPSTILDPNGGFNAWVFTDSSSAEFQGVQQNIVVPNDSQTYTASIFVQKTPNASNIAGINLGLIGGTAVNNYPRFDTLSGVITAGTATITSYNANWWRVQAPITNNSTGNTTLQLQIYAAVGTGGAANTGTAVFFGPQWNFGSTAYGYTATTTTAVTQYALKGLLVENASTNGIRNNVMLGAAVGTPGTLPTNWLGYLSAGTGISTNVIAVGSENGVRYVDIQIVGTPSVNAVFSIVNEANSAIAANNAQTWFYSSWVKIAGGTTTNITSPVFFFDEYATGVFLTGSSTAVSYLTNTLTRFSAGYTTTNASITHTLAGIRFSVTASAAIDITLRIGLPQYEIQSYASSVIPTYGGAVGRSRDEASVAVSSSWYNQSAGTIVVEGVRNTIPAPALTQGAYGAFFTIGDGTINNAYSCRTVAGLSAVYTTVYSGGVETMAYAAVNMSAGAITKCGLAITNASTRMALNGTLAGAADATCTMPTATNLYIGQAANWSFETTFTGWIRNLNYYPLRLPNTTLQNLTKV
jgi:hypothetical protein